MNFYYQKAIEDINAVRDPLLEGFLAMQPAVEQSAVDLYNQDPALARQYITSYTNMCMREAEAAYWDLADLLIAKYNNNQF